MGKWLSYALDDVHWEDAEKGKSDATNSTSHKQQQANLQTETGMLIIAASFDTNHIFPH